MLVNGKISSHQFAILVTIALLTMPLYVASGSRFPNMTFAEYNEVILGNGWAKRFHSYF